MVVAGVAVVAAIFAKLIPAQLAPAI